MDETQLIGLQDTLTEKAQQVENLQEQPTDETEKADQQKAVENKPKIDSKQDTPPAATYGEAWLKSLDATRYTLQVVATRERKQLEALIKKEKLTSDYAYFSKPVKGDTYYVLVIGNYKNREEAISSTSKLSASLRKNKPWPVPVSSVQKFLK